MPREHFHRQLELLRAAVADIGDTADDQIERAMRALERRDRALAAAVVADDAAVNARCADACDLCTILIAEQAPVGSDLRLILASLSIVTELERIADHAVAIARAVERTPAGAADAQSLLATMASDARRMLESALGAYATLDPVAARALGAADDAVDELQEASYRLLVAPQGGDPERVARAVRMLGVAHDLERVADRATNIAEQVIYAATGERVELNVHDVDETDRPAGARTAPAPAQ